MTDPTTTETMSETEYESESEGEHEHADQTTTSALEAETCPECDGQLKYDGEYGEQVCTACGLVVDEQEIDHGPEWRAFDSTERDQRSRVGAPTTNLLHDEGVSSEIGWGNTDANGNTLSSHQRQKMSRLRTWHTRSQTRGSHDRNLRHALGEIERMASALGLPESIRETASVIYRRALKDDLLPGRSIEGVSSAAIYVATRQAKAPRTIDEILVVSRIEQQELMNTYRYLLQELNLEVAPADPRSYLPRFTSEIDVSNDVEYRARDLLETAINEGETSGKNPVGLASAAIYLSALLCGEHVSQRAISEVTGIVERTIRDRYREFLTLRDDISLP